MSHITGQQNEPQTEKVSAWQQSGDDERIPPPPETSSIHPSSTTGLAQGGVHPGRTLTLTPLTMQVFGLQEEAGSPTHRHSKVQRWSVTMVWQAGSLPLGIFNMSQKCSEVRTGCRGTSFGSEQPILVFVSEKCVSDFISPLSSFRMRNNTPPPPMIIYHPIGLLSFSSQRWSYWLITWATKAQNRLKMWIFSAFLRLLSEYTEHLLGLVHISACYDILWTKLLHYV